MTYGMPRWSTLDQCAKRTKIVALLNRITPRKYPVARKPIRRNEMEIAKRSSMIDLRHLRYFLAAAEHGSFRKAGAALGIQESAISRRLRDLEDRLGCTLLFRHSGGVRLTEAGVVFLDHARKAVVQLGRAAAEAGAHGQGQDGRLRIGVCFGLTADFLVRLTSAFQIAHPGLRVAFVQDGAGEHLAAIRNHDIDIAFLADVTRADGCDHLSLWKEGIYVALAEDDDLALRSELTWDDLRGRGFVVSEYSPGPEYHNRLIRNLGSPGLLPKVQRQAVHRDALMHIVASSGQLKLTSEATVAIAFPGVKYRPIAGEILIFSALWSPTNGNPPLRRLLSLIRSMKSAEPL